MDGQWWTFTGETERARIEFSQDALTQVITWEWRPEGSWILFATGLPGAFDKTLLHNTEDAAGQT